MCEVNNANVVSMLASKARNEGPKVTKKANGGTSSREYEHVSPGGYQSVRSIQPWLRYTFAY